MLIKINFPGTICVVNLVSVFCYTNTPAKRKGIFNLKDERGGILRAHACIDTYIHTGRAMLESLNM